MRDENPPVWSDCKAGAEVYYLQHYEEIEDRYQRWCRDNMLDPEDVGSMTAYEDQWR